MKRFKQLVRETAVEPDMPSAAARTYKEKPNKEPMTKLKEEEQLDELSNELLGRYKDKAADDAIAADKAGDFKRGDKRFSGVVKATNKQFANFRKKPFKFGEEVELDEGSVKSQNKQKKNEYVSKIIQKKLHPSVLPSLEYGRRELKKEETEQLDEISAETKSSYTQKATKEVEQLKPHAEKGEYKDIAKNIIKKREKGIAMAKESKEPPFDPDLPKKKQVVPGKHGEAYSRVRHIARQALKKQAEKMKPVKESLEESRKAEIVKEIIKKKKNEKNDTETFQKEPVLSSEITKA
jgi:hypothetical protein